MAEISVTLSGVSSSEVGGGRVFYFASCRNSALHVLDGMSCIKCPERCFPVFPEYGGGAVRNIGKGCPLGKSTTPTVSVTGKYLGKKGRLTGNRI